jgi:hypothetical protein
VVPTAAAPVVAIRIGEALLRILHGHRIEGRWHRHSIKAKGKRQNRTFLLLPFAFYLST